MLHLPRYVDFFIQITISETVLEFRLFSLLSIFVYLDYVVNHIFYFQYLFNFVKLLVKIELVFWSHKFTQNLNIKIIFILLFI